MRSIYSGFKFSFLGKKTCVCARLQFISRRILRVTQNGSTKIQILVYNELFCTAKNAKWRLLTLPQTVKLALTLKIRWKDNKLIISMDLVFASVCFMFESGLLCWIARSQKIGSHVEWPYVQILAGQSGF